MRALKWLLFMLVLAGLALAALLAWLSRAEDGSRWLVENALARLPFSAEARDVRGTLNDGLTVAQLNIELPVARIAGTNIRLDWQPAGLLTGRIVLDNVQIGTLAVDVVPSNEPKEPDPDLLFWLRAPVDVVIRAGRIDALRVEQAAFTQVETRGAIGWGRLRVACRRSDRRW
jgi:translocation and assembly module TamB